ncbi:putative ribonuclease H-like domain-containing protein [Tanacetum coccineum]
MTHPSPKRNMVPKATLMKSGLVSLTTARPVNTVQPRTIVNSARPMTNVFNKELSTIRRLINNKTTTKNNNFNKRVNTVSGKNVNTVRPKAVVNAARPKAVLNAVKGNQVNTVKASACWVWKPKTKGNPQQDLEEKGMIDSGCSRHMTWNMSYLTDFEEIDGGYVAFGGNPKGGKIIGKVPRKNNMYSVDLKNIVPKGGLTCLFAKATSDESKLWHRRLGHINFKTTNKLVKGNLVRGLPSNLFENDQTCVACLKGKQHRASSNSKIVSSISQPLHMLHMDLFGLTFVKSLMKKMYCLVVTDDYVFFLATKDETSGILKSFITGVENLIDQRVKENRILIEAARTMLADSKLPTTFWAKAVNTACYVQNRVLVTKPHNKTPYELFLGRKPALGFMRPFGCPVTILNTIDHLGKFDGKADEEFFVGYSINSKEFKVFNSRTRIVEENIHVQFSENTPNIAGCRPNWLFDIDALTKSMNYKPVVAGNQSNGNAGDNEKKVTEEPRKEDGDSSNDQEKKDNVKNTNNVNAASTNEVNVVGAKSSIELLDDLNMPELEYIVYLDDDEDVGAKADMNNLNTFMPVSPIPTTRIHKDHLVEQIIGDLNLAPQTRRMTKNLEEHGLFSSVQQRTNHKDIQNCLFACFLSQEEPKKVWTMVDLPNGKRAISTKWVYRNKKDEIGIVIKNKARLVARGYTQEEEINYDEVFALVARIEAIRLFLAYASFKDFVVYQMDVKSAFLYGKIEEEVYVCQPPRFEDPYFHDRVYKVEKALYGLHQAPRAWYKTLSTYLLDNGFQRGKIDKTLFIRRDKCDILLVQVYVDNIIFSSTKKSLYTEFEKMMHKKFQMSSMGELTFFLGLQDEDGEEVDVHLYTSMIGSLMYLTSSRPDIMFACKKQTVVANSTTEAEYVAASSCCGQVLWIQNQLLDYGDSNEKKLIQMIKIHTDKNVADLLTKAFDVSMNCLPNATIFEELTRMGYEKLSQKLTFYKAFFSPQWKFLIHTILQCLSAKTTAWNEFSSTMASAIICLATNQKFNFSKYIFESMVKNLDNADKFLMYPRKRLFGRVTPLFLTMVVQAQEEMGEGSAMPTDPHHTPIITQPSSSQPQRKQKSRRSKRKDTEVPQPSDPTNVSDEAVNEEPSMQLKELMDFCTKLQQRVLDLENIKTAQAQEIEDASKHGRKIHDIDTDEDITLENVYDAEMFDLNDLHGDEVFVEKEVLVKEVSVVGKVNTASIAITVSAATITEDEITLAQALAELKSVKPKVTTATTTITKGIFLKSQVNITTTTITSKDKGKAEFDEEVRLAREKDEANIALIKEWNDIQAKIDADYQRA